MDEGAIVARTSTYVTRYKRELSKTSSLLYVDTRPTPLCTPVKLRRMRKQSRGLLRLPIKTVFSTFVAAQKK